MDQDALPPRQVILWRSRTDGVVRVRSAQGRFRDHHEIPLLAPDVIEGQTVEAERQPGEMIVGRQTQNAPTQVEDLPILETCPYCFQIIPEEDGPTPKQPSPHFNFSWAPKGAREGDHQGRNAIHSQKESWDLTSDPARSRKPTQMLLTQPYFRMLERSILSETREASIDTAGPSAINTPSRRSSLSEREETPADVETGPESTGTEGYYARFFVEDKRLGMGAQGTVYLCRHVLNGNFLSYHAVKKIAVGKSKGYLTEMLREVRLLEGLRHKNIIPYEHIWVEPARFSRLAPPIDALHILMMYANLGNIDTYITARHSIPDDGQVFDTSGEVNGEAEPLSAEDRKKLFKRRRLSSKIDPGFKFNRHDVRGVMLFSREEVESLFGDVVEGLAFLHSKGIVHLDIKCQNILLHLFEEDLIPTCMISDFGSSRAVYQYSERQRTGETGTMEYLVGPLRYWKTVGWFTNLQRKKAPETIIPNASGQFLEMNSKLDIWGLGMILHKILFFNLPYGETSTYDELAERIKAYQGYKATPESQKAFERRGLPVEMLDLLEKLLHIDPGRRPDVASVLRSWTLIKGQAYHRQETSVVSSIVTQIPTSQGSADDTPPDSRKPPHLALPPCSNNEERGWRLSEYKELTKYAVAALKIASCVPPLRHYPLPTARFYLVLVMALVDLARDDIKLSFVLAGLHILVMRS